MRDYQRQKSNPYILPYNLYRQTLYQIRDYSRMVEDYNDILEESAPPPDGQPKGNGTGDPTAQKVINLESLSKRIKAIEKAKKQIPEEYMHGIWQNIIYSSAYPNDADRTTYGRWKSKFVYEVAKNLYLI